ncbi:proline-rich protein HaeIII subfamily 1-like [Pteronotus mesoamericanus]|uniref:proline-rich protein HaeIII subfamily 1-like n=1 Tax=Pteronotus mesoamericanus TaxID=1884717 RepID=UPI0023EA7EB8|nr:proline-rich protein HaeIII subfamily 1-like [Pteronotus parnellii mesoamericanus]
MCPGMNRATEGGCSTAAEGALRTGTLHTVRVGVREVRRGRARNGRGDNPVPRPDPNPMQPSAGPRAPRPMASTARLTQPVDSALCPAARLAPRPPVPRGRDPTPGPPRAQLRGVWPRSRPEARPEGQPLASGPQAGAMGGSSPRGTPERRPPQPPPRRPNLRAGCRALPPAARSPMCLTGSRPGPRGGGRSPGATSSARWRGFKLPPLVCTPRAAAAATALSQHRPRRTPPRARPLAPPRPAPPPTPSALCLSLARRPRLCLPPAPTPRSRRYAPPLGPRVRWPRETGRPVGPLQEAGIGDLRPYAACLGAGTSSK